MFLPVTEPIRVDGIGEAPRLGVRLGLDKAEGDPVLSCVLRRRRLRGRIDAVSESRAVGKRVLEEEVREGIIASGILPNGPGASTRGDSN